MAEYDVQLYNAFGRNSRPLNDYTSLEFVRIVNNVGALTIVLPATSYTLDEFQIDGHIAIFRRPVGGAWALEGETIWFVRRITHTLSPNGEALIKLLAYDAIHLLQRAIVAYAAGSAQADKAGAADDMMKAIVRENLGDLATDTARDISNYLSVAPYLGLGPFIDKRFAWKNVLQVLKEIADTSAQTSTTSYLAFDIVATTVETLQFRTYMNQRGKDRRYPGSSYYPIGSEHGNLVNVERVYDYSNEWNFVYAGGQGEEEDRDIETASDDFAIAVSPLNRIEKFHNATQAETTAQLQDEARRALWPGVRQITYSGDIESVDEYGVKWGWGDFVTADFGGIYAPDCRIESVKISVSGGIEKISTRLKVASEEA